MLKATDDTQKNFAALYYLSRKYGVQKLTEDVENCIVNISGNMQGLDDDYTLVLPDGINDVTDRYKLLVSKTPFYDYLVPELEDIEKEIVQSDDETILGYTNKDIKKASLQENWYAKNISIKLVRASGVIDRNKTFSNGRLSIKPHQSFTATAAVKGLQANSKEVNPALQLQQILEASGFELIPLNESSKSVDTNYKVELSDVGNEDALKHAPLEIEVNHALSENETVIALTMVDDIIVPLAIADAIVGGNGFQVKLDTLQVQNAAAENKKNIIRAAWFCFAKVVLRKNLSMLRRVTVNGGEVNYDKNDLAGKIKNARKIVLYIHGIIGNTKGMATGLQFLQNENKYDLFLAYDYENLNTKIEDIATDLKEQLQKIGVGADRPIDIIAHSMGGLMSRYLIEHLEGTENWVNRLFLFGTPNGGSVLGKLPLWRNRLMAVLTLACNYGKAFLGTVGPVLEAINKGLGISVPVTITLGQMDYDSDFYKLLNAPAKNKVETVYALIAGSIINYQPADDNGKFSRIMEKIELQVGRFLYSDAPSDIAVGVESIFQAPVGYVKNKTEISGHHLNYFENAASVNYFKTLVYN